MIISGDEYIARKLIGSVVIAISGGSVWLPPTALGWKVAGMLATCAAIIVYLWFLRDLKPGAEWLDLQNHSLEIHLFRLHRTIALDSIDHVWKEVNHRQSDREHTNRAKVVLKDGAQVALPTRSELHVFFRRAESIGSVRLIQTYSKDQYA